MSTFIVVDSCCDLPLTFIEAHQACLEVIGMPVNVDGFEYYDDLGKTFTHDALYSKLRQGIMPSTAQINSYRFSEIFEKHVALNQTVVYVGFSSEMSGTFESANSSIELVKEKYPSADIRVIDTKSASIGQGLLTMKAVELCRKNKSADEIVNWIETYKMRTHHWFAVDDLNYLKSGGRITPTEAAIGTLLSVKPILIVNQDGVLKPYTKIKGRKKSMKFLCDKFKEHFNKTVFGKVIIGHGNVIEEAVILKDMLLEHMDESDIVVSELSATIASHVGPGMLAISFMGQDREHR